MTYIAFGTILIVLLVVGTVYAMLGRARAQAAILFRHIGLIVQQNLPLSPALDLAAETESGSTQRILKRLADRVDTGLPLSQSLLQAYPGCPALPLSIVQSAEKTGTLPAALCELNQRLSRTPPPSETDASKRGLYFAMALIAFLLLYGGAILGTPSVVPSLNAILNDLSMEMPPLTQDVLEAAQPLGTTPRTWLGIFFRFSWVVLTLAAPIALVVGLLRLRPRRADRVGMLSLVFDFVQWRVWLLRNIAKSRGCVNSLPAMRLALAAGWSLPDAIQMASNVEANTRWQAKLKEWGRRISNGQDPIAEGHKLRLPTILLSYLAVGIRDGNPDAALHNAEEYYTCLLHRWRKHLVQIFWPLLTIYLGFLVGTLSLGIFQGIAAIVDRYSQQIW